MSGMKKRSLIFKLVGFVVLSVLFCSKIFAVSITATSSLSWQISSYGFANGDSATGFVKFLDGFSVPTNGNVTFNITEPVAGSINCNQTGRLILDGHLILAPNISLINNLAIDGQGYAVLLDGNLTVPSGRLIHIISDTIIDGRGSTLYLDDYAHISVDNNATLTLKNIRIKNTQNGTSNPIVRPSGHRAHVALQNVELALADDFIFRDGRLFVYDNVIVTGESTFSYRSTQESYICDCATLGFDKDTTFEYFPSTDNNNLIKMQSETSTLYLDGATLQATHTGMRLTNGRLCFDNNVMLRSAMQTRLVSLTTPAITVTPVSTKDVLGLAWSPDGRYVAVTITGGTGNEIFMYSFNGSALTLVTSFGRGGTINKPITWSPDGKYISFGLDSNGGSEFQIYRFNGSSLSIVFAVSPADAAVNSVAWHPDGNYIAMAQNHLDNNNVDTGMDEVLVYSFNGATASLTTARVSESNKDALSLAWHPSGDYLAVGFATGTNTDYDVRVYSFDGSSFAPAGGLTTIGGDVNSISWSPDGQYIVAGLSSSASSELHVYRFDGSSLSIVHSISPANVDINSVAWAPDGRYFAVGTDTSTNEFYIYSFDGQNISSSILTLNLGTESVNSVSWRPDGKYIALGTTGDKVYVYEVNYTTETNPQTFGNGIIFGDSSPTGDALDVQVLAEAQVSVDGYVTVDK